MVTKSFLVDKWNNVGVCVDDLTFAERRDVDALFDAFGRMRQFAKEQSDWRDIGLQIGMGIFGILTAVGLIAAFDAFRIVLFLVVLAASFVIGGFIGYRVTPLIVQDLFRTRREATLKEIWAISHRSAHCDLVLAEVLRTKSDLATEIRSSVTAPVTASVTA